VPGQGLEHVTRVAVDQEQGAPTAVLTGGEGVPDEDGTLRHREAIGNARTGTEGEAARGRDPTHAGTAATAPDRARDDGRRQEHDRHQHGDPSAHPPKVRKPGRLQNAPNLDRPFTGCWLPGCLDDGRGQVDNEPWCWGSTGRRSQSTCPEPSCSQPWSSPP